MKTFLIAGIKVTIGEQLSDVQLIQMGAEPGRQLIRMQIPCPFPRPLDPDMASNEERLFVRKNTKYVMQYLLTEGFLDCGVYNTLITTIHPKENGNDGEVCGGCG